MDSGGIFTRLAKGKAAHLLAAGERRDPLLLLLFRTKLQNRPNVERLRAERVNHVIPPVAYSHVSVLPGVLTLLTETTTPVLAQPLLISSIATEYAR